MAMIEAASIDKAMHVADMERAMGELLEFDNTIKTVLAHLKKVRLHSRSFYIQSLLTDSILCVHSLESTKIRLLLRPLTTGTPFFASYPSALLKTDFSPFLTRLNSHGFDVFGSAYVIDLLIC